MLPLAQLKINSRPISAMRRLSPFFLRNGYHLDPLMEPSHDLESISRHLWKFEAQKYVLRLIDTQDFAQVVMASAQQRNEHHSNESRRQTEMFKSGDKILLNLRNVRTPQLSKQLAWLHVKCKVTAVPVDLTVELNVPYNIHNRFHAELVKRASDNQFQSQ